MPINKKPFVNYTLDEEKEQDTDKTVIAISFNRKEWLQLMEDKQMIGEPKNATAIKLLVEIGRKVILSQFQGEYWSRHLKKKGGS